MSHKLKENSVKGKLGVWLHNFLSERKQFVLVGNEISDETKVISGCPQGTVLGPILAIIFLCDVDKDVNNLIQMFCDDTRLLGSIASEEDVEEVQSDLNKIYHWAEQNNMEFNDKKFEVLRYGTNNDIKENTFSLSSNCWEILHQKKM